MSASLKFPLRPIGLGASSIDVEQEIINSQQDVLKGLENLDKMTAQAADGRARITPTFALGTDMDKALLLTANRLDRISTYPAEANQLTLSTTGSEDNPIAWFRLVFRTENRGQNIRTYRDFAENTIKERIERIAGVGEVNIFGGRPEEMQIEIDPFRMAQYGLTVSEILRKLRQANFANTAGTYCRGQTPLISYELITPSETKEQVRETVLLSVRPHNQPHRAGAVGGCGHGKLCLPKSHRANSFQWQPLLP